MEEYFAALRIPDPEHDGKLTRTLSYSELPTSRRIWVEQYYHTDGSTGMVRQCSFEQIFDKKCDMGKVKIAHISKTNVNPTNECCTTSAQFNDVFKIPDWPVQKKKDVMQPSVSVQEKDESMEIDEIESTSLSLNRSTSPKIEFPRGSPRLMRSRSVDKDSTIPENKEKNVNSSPDQANYQELKKNLRSLVQTTPNTKIQTKSMSCLPLLFFILLPTLLILLAIVMKTEHLDHIFDPLDETSIYYNTSMELKNKVYGQKEAIYNLNYQLAQNESIKIMCLIGPTGVGKSYSIDIIRRNYPYQDYIFTFFSPLEFELNVKTLSSIFCNLIIIENLKEQDLASFAKFLKPLSTLETNCVTVMAVLNTGVDGDAQTIKNRLQKEGLEASIVAFKPLTTEILDKCIRDAAKISDLVLTEDQTSRVRNKLLEANAGCKGAYAKVQIFGRE